MKRLMPFRDYDEHDVINLFALDVGNSAIGDSGNGDSGVIVKVSNGTINSDVVTANNSSAYLGKSDYPNVGRVAYWENPMKITPCAAGAVPLGITLFETAMYDENGEKLIYYKQKALENQVVFSGESVPVATRGMFTLDDSAFQLGSIPAPGTQLAIATGAGKFAALGATGVTGQAAAGTVVYGQVLATGSRVAGTTADYFAGSAGATGTYAIVRVNFA